MNKKIDEKIISILTNANLKITEARCELLKILLSANAPQNYEQIKAKLSFPMDKTTFYRNMQTFEKKALINKFESKDRVWHYEIGSDTHAHFMCEVCSKIECLELDIPPLLKGYEVSTVTLKGKCDECLGESS